MDQSTWANFYEEILSHINCREHIAPAKQYIRLDSIRYSNLYFRVMNRSILGKIILFLLIPSVKI